MASRNRLDQAAGASIGGFFTKADEQPETKQERRAYTDEQMDEALKTVYRTGRQQDGADLLGMNKGTFSRKKREIEENEPERVERLKAAAGQESTTQDTQKPTEATEKPEPMKSTPEEEKAVEKADTKPQKQVFSFRASIGDIAIWKAYATATGQKMEDIGTAAMNEYIGRHQLTGAELTVFEAMKSKVDK